MYKSISIFSTFSIYHFLLNLIITYFSFLLKNKRRTLTILSNLKENLQNALNASPSLWITTRIATHYRGSIEYLHTSILKFWNSVFFMCRLQLNHGFKTASFHVSVCYSVISFFTVVSRCSRNYSYHFMWLYDIFYQYDYLYFIRHQWAFTLFIQLIWVLISFISCASYLTLLARPSIDIS